MNGSSSEGIYPQLKWIKEIEIMTNSVKKKGIYENNYKNLGDMYMFTYIIKFIMYAYI